MVLLKEGFVILLLFLFAYITSSCNNFYHCYRSYCMRNRILAKILRISRSKSWKQSLLLHQLLWMCFGLLNVTSCIRSLCVFQSDFFFFSSFFAFPSSYWALAWFKLICFKFFKMEFLCPFCSFEGCLQLIGSLP